MDRNAIYLGGHSPTMPCFYPYPFDLDGEDALTLPEHLAITRAVEHELYRILGPDWRWSELTIRIIGAAHNFIDYNVIWKGIPAGHIVVDIPRALDRPIVETHNLH